jgi:hypothetical protein
MSESIANRDAAFECLDIAKAALRAGDHVRAEKFSQKALKLYRCQQVGIDAMQHKPVVPFLAVSCSLCSKTVCADGQQPSVCTASIVKLRVM